MRQVLGPGALGRPRGIGWRGRWEGVSGWGIHVYPWLIHVSVWQKPLQYCKVISLQLIKINEKKKNTGMGCHSFLQGSSWPRGRTWVSRIAGRFFTIWATREALPNLYYFLPPAEFRFCMFVFFLLRARLGCFLEIFSCFLMKVCCAFKFCKSCFDSGSLHGGFLRRFCWKEAGQ